MREISESGESRFPSSPLDDRYITREQFEKGQIPPERPPGPITVTIDIPNYLPYHAEVTSIKSSGLGLTPGALSYLSRLLAGIDTLVAQELTDG